MLTKEILKNSFWSLPVKECLGLLATTETGLTRAEAQERLADFGRNKLPEKKRITKLKLFFSQFKSPFIVLLLVAGVITLFLQDFKDAIFILAAAAANAILGFYQENKAEEALAHLKTYIEERVRVFRDGHEIEIDTAELVPGDVVHLSQGDRAPADARLIYANDLQVDQSILTGESLPVAKVVATAPPTAPLVDRRSMIFSGTAVAQGFGNAVVTATGRHTEIGKIALLVGQAEREQTPLQKNISRFSWQIGLILLGLTALIFLLGIYGGHSIFDMFLISVAVAVSAVPEALPITLTVILAIGVRRLAGRRGIVRKLLAAETLGGTTIVLTDKTGTLTQAKMDLAQVKIFNGAKTDIEKRDAREQLFKVAIINSNAVVENPDDHPNNWEIIGRPLEIAAVKAAAKEGVLLPTLKKELKVVDYLPFNSADKLSASLVKDGNDGSASSADKFTLSLFGAPEFLLAHADLAEDEKEKILAEVDKMAHSGERVLAAAIKKIPRAVALGDKNNFRGVEFLGTISFHDPLRPEAKDAIERITRAGVKVVIVTGDHRGTALAVAREVGLKVSAAQMLDGAELESLGVEALREKLSELKVVSRVSPEGKLKILQAYQANGETVAMTGDGVNDAPTLKAADIGVAMGSGADVSQDVADLVLLDDNFETIVEAVNEGRRILNNIRKGIVYLLSNALDAVILIGGSLLLGLPTPLNPLQILWVNFFTDSFPGISLAFEDGHDWLKQKPRRPARGLLDKEMKFLIFFIGTISSLLLLAIYGGLLYLGFDQQLVRTFVFAIFGTYTLFLIFAMRDLQRSVFTINPFKNMYLVASSAIGFIFMMLAVYWPPLQSLLGTVSLPVSWLWGVIGVGIFNILLIELGKWSYRK